VAKSSTSTLTSTLASPTLINPSKLARKLTNIRQYIHKRKKEGKRTNGHVERILQLLLRLLVVTWATGTISYNTMYGTGIIWLYCIIYFTSDCLTKNFTSFTTSREALVLVKLIITCKALSLMRIAHLQSISSARAYELNTITFTYYATSIPRSDLRVVLRVPGEPTITNVLKEDF